VKKTTGFYLGPSVDTRGRAAVGQAGGMLLTSTVKAIGLDVGLSAALAPWRPANAVRDPAKVLPDLALTLALGGAPARTSPWSALSRRSSVRSPRTRRRRARSLVWPTPRSQCSPRKRPTATTPTREKVIAELKNGPLAHLPSGQMNANAAWLVLAAIAFNLTRAAGTLASRFHARATTATIRAQLIAVPARIARSARRLRLHLPDRWPWESAWQAMFAAAAGPPIPAT